MCVCVEFFLFCSAVHTGPGNTAQRSSVVCAVCVMDSMLLDQTVQIDGWIVNRGYSRKRENEREKDWREGGCAGH